MWYSIALHTTPGIPQHKKPEVALVTAGVEMDVLGLGYLDVPDPHREAVVNAHPRGDHFKEQIIHAFHDGFGHKPETTFGTVNGRRARAARPEIQTGQLLQHHP